MFVPNAVNIDKLESVKPELGCEEPRARGDVLKMPAARLRVPATL